MAIPMGAGFLSLHRAFSMPDITGVGEGKIKMNYQVMPPLSNEEYAELKNDIAQRGVMVPIEYDEQGNVLDGHHRLQVCAELGITEYPKVIRAGMTEAEKRTHARKLNMARRQLNREQKQELIREQLRETPEKSDRQIARELGVDKNTVNARRVELETGGEIHHLDTTMGADGKQYPRQVERKVSVVDNEDSTAWNEYDEKAALYDLDELFIEHPCLSDLVEVVEKPRKPVSVFNPTKREEKAIQNTDVVKRMADTGASVLIAEKQIKQQERQAAIQEQIDKPKASSHVDIYATDKKYRVIYADPPWSYNDKQDTGMLGGAVKHYPTMPLQDICDLPVPAADNAVLFLWVTSPLLEDSFKVINAWGFKYKSSFVWDKVAHNMGHYNSVRHEFLLIATRGSCTPDVAKLYDSVVSVERAEHSRKPKEFRDMIDALYPVGDRLEMFAREAPEGWDVWGNMA